MHAHRSYITYLPRAAGCVKDTAQDAIQAFCRGRTLSPPEPIADAPDTAKRRLPPPCASSSPKELSAPRIMSLLRGTTLSVTKPHLDYSNLGCPLSSLRPKAKRTKIRICTPHSSESMLQRENYRIHGSACVYRVADSLPCLNLHGRPRQLRQTSTRKKLQSKMSYPEQFEGWAAHGPECLQGNFKKTKYTPKVRTRQSSRRHVLMM